MKKKKKKFRKYIEKILYGANLGAQVTKYMCDLKSSRIEYRTKH